MGDTPVSERRPLNFLARCQHFKHIYNLCEKILLRLERNKNSLRILDEL